jgi:hypothetical protein
MTIKIEAIARLQVIAQTDLDQNMLDLLMPSFFDDLHPVNLPQRERVRLRVPYSHSQPAIWVVPLFGTNALIAVDAEAQQLWLTVFLAEVDHNEIPANMPCKSFVQTVLFGHNKKQEKEAISEAFEHVKKKVISWLASNQDTKIPAAPKQIMRDHNAYPTNTNPWKVVNAD